MIALFAEVITWKDERTKVGVTEKSTDEDTVSSRYRAMTELMDKTELPPSLQKKKNKPDTDDERNESGAVLNPWPTLCDWVFEYPENSLYHHQFIRLFLAICVEHHETTLRLVLQKVKFVARAIKTSKEKGPLRGVLLTCLNILRLRSQSLPKGAFLRQYLHSHDAWKAFQDTLVE